VVPPVCAISFIDNLGTAIAKGADIQAEVAITDSLTAEFSTGFTDARYTSTVGLGSTSPVVDRGDAISGESGQPNAPWTASFGLEYHFKMGALPTFVRFDDEFQSRNHFNSPALDANTAQYDGSFYHLSSTNFASTRAGINMDNMQISLFCDNLFDTHTVTNYEFSIIPPDYPATSRLERQFTFRPRTVGLTFTYRH
jgi:iron complex outermembrane receptor protein